MSRRHSGLPNGVWLIGILLLATAVRAIGLGRQSLWVDEGISYARATWPLGPAMWNTLLVGVQTPLYYLLLRGWLVMAGHSEWALRLPSLFASVLSVAVAYRLGRFSGCRVGLVAAALTALNPFGVWYAQEARMYTLGVLFGAGAMLCFWIALRTSGRHFWITLALVSALAYLSHYFTLTLALVQFSFLLLSMRVMHHRFRRWVVAQAAGVLPVGVWLMLAIWKRGTTRLACGWIPQPVPWAPFNTLWNFSLGYTGRLTAWIILGLIPFGMALALGVALTQGDRLWRRFLLFWLVLPILVTFLLSLRRPYYVDRYLTIVLPAYMTLLAGGVVVPRQHWVRVVLGGALFATTLVALVGLMSGACFAKENWRGAVALVRSAAQAGDRMVVMRFEDVPVTQYYLQEALPLITLAGQTAPDPLAQVVSSGDRVWFLYRGPVESNHAMGELGGFDPYRQGEPGVMNWIGTHRERVLGEWSVTGLYLFLIDGG